MKIKGLGLVALLVALGTVASPQAVGIKETAKLTVSGPGFPRPLEIVDPAVLALSNVFSGTFIGGAATEPDRSWPRYTVVFDVQHRNGVEAAAYVVHYVRDAATGRGFIYLPGRGDPRYRRNIHTILRTDQDGTWRHASPAWSQAIAARLP